LKEEISLTTTAIRWQTNIR